MTIAIVIAIVVGVAFLTFLIGYAIGAMPVTDPFEELITTNRMIREIVTNQRAMNHGNIYYAKTPSEQEILDIVDKASQPLNELKGKLGIK